MLKTVNLAIQIQKQLPAELVEFMHQAGSEALSLGQKLYLVGGVVRDLLLQRPNLDLDLVVEGDAICLATEMARLKSGKVVAHSRFNTAKIKWDRWSVDIATARSEFYAKPGDLPSFQAKCDIQSDLIRRDFTINAMAVDLSPDHYGELIDLYHGSQDLEKHLIRILHDKSFIDDATRIWRSIRYEQRLGFRIESHTLDLLKRDIVYLDTISGDRIRHELELCLEEGKPEAALMRASELGVLTRMSPSLKADEWLSRKIAKARGMLQPYCPPEEIYLAFLIYHLSHQELDDLIIYLKLPRIIARTLQDTLDLKSELPALASPALSSSRIYHYLHSYTPNSILANLIAIDSPLVRQRMELYLNNLRHIQPALTGEELIQLGLSPGPQIKEVLEILREARLDGRVTTREEELEMVNKMGKASPGHLTHL